MDSGMAAIIGARCDPQARAARRTVVLVLVLDVATSHTVGAAFEGDELRGRFEFHTKDLTVERLDVLVDELVEGRLDVARVLAEGGHGGWQSGPLDGPPAVIISTGPKRDRIQGLRDEMVLGAPLGDNMMTGTAGLLEAIRQRQACDAQLKTY